MIDNKLLLAKHKEHPCYYTIGGKVELYESTEEAIIREMKEETGIEYQIEHLAFVQERFYKNNSQNLHEITFFYKIQENSLTRNLDHALTDQGEDEMMFLLDIQELNRYNIVPVFFKDIDLKNIRGITHIVSRT